MDVMSLGSYINFLILLVSISSALAITPFVNNNFISHNDFSKWDHFVDTSSNSGVSTLSEEDYTACLHVDSELPPCNFRSEFHVSSNKKKNEPSTVSKRSFEKRLVIYVIEGCVPLRLPFNLPSCKDIDVSEKTIETRKLYPFKVETSTDRPFIFPKFDLNRWIRMMRRIREQNASTRNIEKLTVDHPEDLALHGPRHSVLPIKLSSKKTIMPKATIAKAYISKGSSASSGFIAHPEKRTSYGKLAFLDGVKDANDIDISPRETSNKATETGFLNIKDNDENKLKKERKYKKYQGLPESQLYNKRKLRSISSRMPGWNNCNVVQNTEIRHIKPEESVAKSGQSRYFKNELNNSKHPKTSDNFDDSSSMDTVPNALRRRRDVENLFEFPYSIAIPYDPKKLGIDRELRKFLHGEAGTFGSRKSREIQEGSEFPYSKAIPYDPKRLEIAGSSGSRENRSQNLRAAADCECNKFLSDEGRGSDSEKEKQHPYLKKFQDKTQVSDGSNKVPKKGLSKTIVEQNKRVKSSKANIRADRLSRNQ